MTLQTSGLFDSPDARFEFRNYPSETKPPQAVVLTEEATNRTAPWWFGERPCVTVLLGPRLPLPEPAVMPLSTTRPMGRAAV